MCTVLLSPGYNPIAVNKYIDIILRTESPVKNLGRLPLYGGINYGIKELIFT
jgi:hypothetical protein